MNIELHIEHLILDGLPLSRAQSMDVQQALEVELTRLLEAGTLQDQLGRSQVIPSVRSEMPDAHGTERFGQGLAQAVYAEIGQGGLE